MICEVIFLFRHGRARPARSRRLLAPFHEENHQPRDGHQHGKHEEGVVEGHHGGLLYELFVEDSQRPGVELGWREALIFQDPGYLRQGLLEIPVQDAHPLCQAPVVELGPPGDERARKGNAEAPA